MTTKRPPTPIIRPSVVFDPNLLDGINTMADAVKSTLGPLARMVGVERVDRNHTPELLDDAGTIARRIIQIEDETADVGAMMLRHAMWRMRERHGDGAATMAMLAQAMIYRAWRGAAAGFQPQWLRRGIETGAKVVAGELQRCARPLPPGKAGRAMLSSLAYSLSSDKELMDAIVQIVNNVGSDAAVEVVVNERRTVDVEFVEGAVWNAGWLSAAFVTDRARNLARQENVGIVIFDGQMDDAQQAFAAVQRWSALGFKRVALIANGVGDEAMQVFTRVHLQGAMGFILVRPPFVDAERITALEDMSALTGAHVLYDVGELIGIEAEQVGFARRMWATSIKFGIIAGRRDSEALRNRIKSARAGIANFSDYRQYDQLRKLRWRLAQLTGGSAVLQVGAVSKTIAETRKEHAERLIQVLQMVAGAGVVAGGGAALFACRHAVERAAAATENEDERYGVRCVLEALSVPMEIIARNAGYDPAPILAQVKQSPDGHGFDARGGQVVDMAEAGIMDSLAVIERAIHTAASVAAMVVTTTCVVHQRKPFPAGNKP